MLPTVKVNRLDGQTSVVKPGVEGILAIIAPSSLGTANQPTGYTDANKALTVLGYGILVSAAAYVMALAGNPVVLVKAAASTPGAIGSPTLTGTGTTTPSAHSGAHPVDDFPNVLLNFVTGGTLGVAGITYTYSLDNGANNSPLIALGTATSITIPNTGITIDFTHSSNTLVAGDVVSFACTGPRMNQSDLDAALVSLKAYGGAWEAVLVLGCDASATLVGDLDTWCASLEATGRNRLFGINTRFMNAGETEGDYLTAMTTLAATMSSIRGFVGTDCGDMADSVNGCVQPRATALYAMARAMKVAISVELARVADGAVSNCVIQDVRGNPKHHDEQQSPGLDDLRLVTLRTFPSKAGVYITNGNLISPPGSDYVFVPHARVMNKTCDIAFDSLTNQLSQGVQDNGSGHIAEGDALTIESLTEQQIVGQIVVPRHASGADFVLHRDDDISSNAGATISGDAEILALKYIKKFNVNAKYVSRLTRTVTVGG